MLLIDLSDTSRRFEPTGIHRISRGLYFELCRRMDGVPVCFDRWQGRWRRLNQRERSHLDELPSEQAVSHSPRGPGAFWREASEFIVGVSSRLVPSLAADTHLSSGSFDGLIMPEINETRRPREVAKIRRHLNGAAVAVFHDLIPVRFPKLARPRSVANFPAYLETLLSYDGIAAVSESSKQDLIAYWASNGVTAPPPVETIPPAGRLKLSTDIAPAAGSTGRPIILMVGTVEPRKNHLAVLEAAERLWQEGLDFQLRFAGRLRDGNRSVIEQIDRLRSMGRSLRWLGYISDAQLALEYQACRFTLYPSLYEGLGLPVLESLGHGKPCLVSNRGALAETAGSGGCHMVEDTTADALAEGIRALLKNEDLYRRLTGECSNRELKDWGTYCEELTAWQRTLKKRAVN